MFRRWRAAWPKRARWSNPPWLQASQATPTPAIHRQPGWRPRLAPLPRRGRYIEPIWPQGSTATPTPNLIRQAGARPRFAAKLRRARYSEPAWPQASQAVPPPAIHRAAGPRPLRFPALPRRGHSFEPPWPQGQLPTGRPEFTRARPRPLPYARRARYLPLPPPAAPDVPRYQCTRRTPRVVRRGTYQTVIPAPPSAWVPSAMARRRPAPLPVRHAARYATPVPAPVPLGPGLRIVSARESVRWSAREGGSRWSAREAQ